MFFLRFHYSGGADQAAVFPMREQSISLVAAFNLNGELLLLKRPQGVHCAGLWSFPGGKLGAGEDAMQAARRELQEETGLSGDNWQLLGKHHFNYPDRRLNFILFSCLSVTFTTLCCADEWRWVAPSDITRYTMPEANAALLPLIFPANGIA